MLTCEYSSVSAFPEYDIGSLAFGVIPTLTIAVEIRP